MDEQELAAIEARTQATSAGPWRFPYGPERGPARKTKAARAAQLQMWQAANGYAWVWDDHDRAILSVAGGGRGPNDRLDSVHPSNRANLEFVAHAREDVPALVAEVRRLRQALADAGAPSE